MSAVEADGPDAYRIHDFVTRIRSEMVYSLVAEDRGLDEPFRRVLRYAPLAARIDECGSDDANRRNETWANHADINDVMPATALGPDGYFGSQGADVFRSNREYFLFEGRIPSGARPGAPYAEPPSNEVIAFV